MVFSSLKSKLLIKLHFKSYKIAYELYNTNITCIEISI